MQEENGFAVRADTGGSVAQNAGAGSLQVVPGGDEVLDLVADVVDAAVGVFLRNVAIGEALAEGSSSSILVFGSSMNTTVTPCSACRSGADTVCPERVLVQCPTLS